MFSVVIPTHNGLELLRDAVQSVLKQDRPDWELVVFDNASTDDIEGYMSGLGDPRVRCERSEEFLPVTDSWNRAIDLAKGRYVTFLGNDDGLTPGYFSGFERIISDFNEPEILYTAIFQFLHPGVAPWERQGYVADVKNAFFFGQRHAPFRLSQEEALHAVEGSLGLRRNFTFNIQAFMFSRRFLESRRSDGPVFRSPFPDYYLANVALAKAGSIVVIPAPMAIAGVSKASFGFTLFNGLEEQGAALLNGKLALDPLYQEIKDKILPGPLYNTNYVVTMEHVARYAQGVIKKDADFARYRRLQTFAVIASSRAKDWKRTPAGKALWPKLATAEKAWATCVGLALATARLLRLYNRFAYPYLERRLGLYGFHPVVRVCDKGSFARLGEVFAAIERGAITGLPALPSPKPVAP